MTRESYILALSIPLALWLAFFVRGVSRMDQLEHRISEASAAVNQMVVEDCLERGGTTVFNGGHATGCKITKVEAKSGWEIHNANPELSMFTVTGNYSYGVVNQLRFWCTAEVFSHGVSFTLGKYQNCRLAKASVEKYFASVGPQ